MTNSMPSYDVFIDSDVFVGLSLVSDPLHQRASLLLQRIKRTGLTVVTSQLVVAEAATVLSHKHGMQLAKFFLRNVASFETLFVSAQLHAEALELFVEQSKKGSSFVDCANVVVMRHYGIQTIASFDKAYPKQYGVRLFVGE